MSSAEAMVTAQGHRASPPLTSAAADGSLANPVGASSASSCCFPTHPHSFLLIYAVLHFSHAYPLPKMS